MSLASLTGNGLRDWLVQRATAVVMLVLVCVLAVFFICHPHPTYVQWHGLFSQLWMKVLTLLAFLALTLHAWIGVWMILTDYIKCFCLRVLLEVVTISALFACLIWAGFILGRVG